MAPTISRLANGINQIVKKGGPSAWIRTPVHGQECRLVGNRSIRSRAPVPREIRRSAAFEVVAYENVHSRKCLQRPVAVPGPRAGFKRVDVQIPIAYGDCDNGRSERKANIPPVNCRQNIAAEMRAVCPDNTPGPSPHLNSHGKRARPRESRGASASPSVAAHVRHIRVDLCGPYHQRR